MKKFHLTNSYVLIDFDASNVETQASIINSEGFEKLLKAFYQKQKNDQTMIYFSLKHLKFNEIFKFYKLLLIYTLEDAIKESNSITVNDIDNLYNFTESLYDYWRNLERFGLLKGSKKYNNINKSNDLITSTNNFNNLIISIYRTIAEKLLDSSFNIYRQLPAGINANMLYVSHKFSVNKEFSKLQDISFVTKVVTNPPFIIKSKSNTRSELFSEIDYNPLTKLNINKKHFLAFPVMVGPLLAFVYIHRDFLHHGIALSNLFEFANYEDFKDKQPNLVFVYGIEETSCDYNYYYDTKEDIYFGFVSRIDKNDYFGYLKKMLLTLHNVYMIKKGNLPIHGAMANITLSNNQTKNIVVIGDSGAGKSETLEALQQIGTKDIKQMDIIFDDMGTFKFSNDVVVANGTETGAFVRLDDLDTGYAYEIMDRALFLNPNQINARVVIPITKYQDIISNHKVDLVLYANNYAENNIGITIFSDYNDALDVFRKGVRKAKGTTNEVGLVSSYFANPFGPVQLQEETDLLLQKYFTHLSESNIPVGEIYTKLAVEGFETKGPLIAAEQLLEYIKGVLTNE